MKIPYVTHLGMMIVLQVIIIIIIIITIIIIIIVIIIITEHFLFLLGFSLMEFFWLVPKKLVISYSTDLELGD